LSTAPESLSECYEGGHTRVWVPGAKTDSLFSTPDKPTDLLTMQLQAFGLDAEQFEGKVDEIQAAIRVAKRDLEEKEPYYGNFSDEELTDVIQTNVFPNAILTLSARDAMATAAASPCYRPQSVLSR
jgi:hypothetical protein